VGEMRSMKRLNGLIALLLLTAPAHGTPLLCTNGVAQIYVKMDGKPSAPASEEKPTDASAVLNLDQATFSPPWSSEK